jgi:hypothetical protein
MNVRGIVITALSTLARVWSGGSFFSSAVPGMAESRSSITRDVATPVRYVNSHAKITCDGLSTTVPAADVTGEFGLFVWSWRRLQRRECVDPKIDLAAQYSHKAALQFHPFGLYQRERQLEYGIRMERALVRASTYHC